MSYYQILGFDKEPFSTSPDPDFFYRSSTHDAALKRLEIAIRLRRGLSLVIGDVGAGKTTLSRALVNYFCEEEDFLFFMIMDPGYRTEFQFLLSLAKIFDIMPKARSTVSIKQSLELFLYQKGVEEKKTIVMLLDEGQVIKPESMEVLRMLLNYETNDYKLLQLVIFAQKEFLLKIENSQNFMDRIALKYVIEPLDVEDTARMIEYRLRQAGYGGEKELFSSEAIRLIHEHTKGHPRKIALLCHDALENLVMQEKQTVDRGLVQGIIELNRKFRAAALV
jgi:general secretion pathway protein A